MPVTKKKQPWPQGRTTGVLFNELEPVLFDPFLDPPGGACYNCWEQGHTRRQCPKNIYPGDFCHNRGRLDVVMSTCPRCSKAYASWAKNRDIFRLRTHPRTGKPAAFTVGPLIDLDSSIHGETDLESPTPTLAPSLLDDPIPSAQPLSCGTVLVVTGLDSATTEPELRKLFSEFGPVLSANLHRRLDGQPPETAEVAFRDKLHAVRAMTSDLFLRNKPNK